MFLVVSLKRLPLLLFAVIIIAALLLMRPGAQPALADAAQDLPTLIIDAGHGGADGGAVSVNGISESVINLDIAKKMAALSELLGYPCLLTRESEEISYSADCKTIAAKKRFDQKQRVEFINAADKAVLLSIHQNSFPNAKPYGPQAFYTADDTAQELAALVQGALNTALCPENRRVAAPVSRDIYLMKNIEWPGVLVECGFVSNRSEAALLETSEYRLKIACAVMSAYAQSIK